MNMLTNTIHSVADLDLLAADLLEYAKDDRIFLFYGNLGAGKTTFIQKICQQLGVTETVSSPTFSIVNEYQGKEQAIFHFDFYRLKSEEEAFDLGYEEYFYSGAYCFIEWPEKIPNLLPPAAISIHIQMASDTERIFKFARMS